MVSRLSELGVFSLGKNDTVEMSADAGRIWVTASNKRSFLADVIRMVWRARAAPLADYLAQLGDA